KRAMTSYEVHRFFHGLEISFFPDTFLSKKQKTTPTLFLEDKINLKIILYYQKRLNHNILIINNQKIYMLYH
ncbi:hypothetical protein, partial [uncultured Lactobacillus sp.]|uniref:hypothetical protein n=1 Tax=uncultured Lactobacillus sp. TaxID=153152 RepID=UPI002586B172